MNHEVLQAIEMGAKDALRLYFALLTAPYHISKAFINRPSGEPFLWTWDNRVRLRAEGDENANAESAGIAAP
jgi:hypothetical protein